MKVVQTTPGRFHHFDLARQLHKRDALTKIITGFPAWKLRQHHEFDRLPEDKVVCHSLVQSAYMLASRLFGHTAAFDKIRRQWGYQCLNTLDTYVANNIFDADVYIAQSGCGEKSGGEYKRAGSIYICDRGSTHILHQDETLRAEFTHRGREYSGILPALIEKELREYELCDHLTVPSAQVKRTFISHGIADSKISVIPYGVDLTRFKCEGSPDPNRFDVVFIGGVSFRKGVPYLLEAFSRVEHRNAALHIIGAMSAEMDTYLRENPQPKTVKFYGHVAQSRLKHILSTCHVLCLPSLEEGLALVQAQAMAAGCPVIATTATGCEDLMTDGEQGFIISKPSDTDSLANAMQRIADSWSLFQNLRNNALRRVQSIGGWDKYGQEYHALLTRLL